MFALKEKLTGDICHLNPNCKRELLSFLSWKNEGDGTVWNKVQEVHSRNFLGDVFCE